MNFGTKRCSLCSASKADGVVLIEKPPAGAVCERCVLQCVVHLAACRVPPFTSLLARVPESALRERLDELRGFLASSPGGVPGLELYCSEERMLIGELASRERLKAS